MASYQPTAKDKDLVKALDQVSRSVDSELADKLGDAYGGMGPLRAQHHQPRARAAGRRASASAASAASASSAAPSASAPEAAAPRLRPSRRRPPRRPRAASVTGGLSADSIVDADSAYNAVGETIRILTRAAAALRGADPGDAGAYRLLRAGLWLQVERAPHADNGATYVPAPPGHYKDHLDGARRRAATGRASSRVVEELAAEWPLWLDPHRYAAQALDNLGEPYAAAKRALLREVGLLLARAPGAAGPHLQRRHALRRRGDQAVDRRVKSRPSWAAAAAAAARPSTSSTAKINEARNLVVNGALPDAVQLLMKAAAAAHDAGGSLPRPARRRPALPPGASRC